MRTTDIIDAVILSGMRAVIRIERRIFFFSGVRLPLLRDYWRRRGQMQQAAINEQNGTAVEYGQIEF